MESKKVIRAGYLQHRPGGALAAAIGRLKKKRYWFVLDEANCQLLYFKSDNDASQQPMGVMDIKEACISILPDHNNQFSLVYGGKEQILTADNHRSMMQWLQSLQDVRDSFSSIRKNRYTKSSKSYLFKATTLTSPSKGLASSPALQRRHSEKVDRRRYDDTNGTEGLHRRSGGGSLRAQRSLPPYASVAEYPTATTNSLPLRGISRLNSHDSLEENTTASTSDTQSVNTGDSDTSDKVARFLLFVTCKSSVTMKALKWTLQILATQVLPKQIIYDIDLITMGNQGSRGSTSSEISTTAYQMDTSWAYNSQPWTYEEFCYNALMNGLHSLSTDADGDVERLSEMEDQEELERLDRASLIQRIKEMREELQSAQRKVMSSQNREFTYQQMLKKREQDIMNLDDKLVILEQKQHLKRDMLSSEDLEAARQRILDLQDTCKIYQEQTGFLNTEVRRQNSLRKRDRNKMHVLLSHIDSLECDVLQGKRDYITLMRDGVEVTSMDVKEEIDLDMRWEDKVRDYITLVRDGVEVTSMNVKEETDLDMRWDDKVRDYITLMRDGVEVTSMDVKEEIDLDMRWEDKVRDYITLRDGVEVTSMDVKEEIDLDMRWEDKRYRKFLHLYEEARQQDPVLPDPRLVFVEGHTDTYGFKHPPLNLPNLFHYVCQVLDGHFQASSKIHAEHIKNWEVYIERFKSNFRDHHDELRSLVYGGIPADHRSDVWSQLVMGRVKHIKAEKNEDYFQWLLSRAATSASVDKYRRQIDLDLLRTMPNNVYFNDKATEGILQLRQILEAFCVHNPIVGYCQGMNFIAGMSLLFMDVETAFWCLVAVVESYFPPNYFDMSLIGAQADQSILKDILEQRLPHLQHHLDDIGIEMCSFTLNWFLAIFFEVVPFTTLLRIWDCFLLDGLRIIFQFSVALLRYHEQCLLDKKDILAFLKDAKMLAKQTYDIEGLVKIVQQEAESFPSSTWIEERQAHYMKILHKVYEEQERAREEFERQEGLMSSKPIIDLPMSQDGETQDLKMDCGTECMPGHLVVCRGDIRQGWVSRVDVEHCLKEKGGVRLDNRVMCISLAGLDMVMMGTISWFLYAYSVGTPEELWYERLRDTPLSIVHNPVTKDVYIGLADGTLAVIEGVGHTNPSDIFYHAIGASPVRCVVYIEDLNQIWCACGNAVNILNSSLNIVNGFEVSKNPSVHISSLALGHHGVWVTIRGSAVVTLWDTHTLDCMLMYDTSTDKTPIFNKKALRDSQSASKVTSILPYEDTLWVGTADGHVAIYNVVKLDIQEDHITNDTQVLTDGEDTNPEKEECNDVDDNIGRTGDVEKSQKDGEDGANREHSDEDISRVDIPNIKSKKAARNYEMVTNEFGFAPPPIPLHGYESGLEAIDLPLPLSDVDSDTPLSPPPVLVTDIDDNPPVLPAEESRPTSSDTMLDSPSEPVLKRVPTPPGPIMDSKNRVPSITPLPALELEFQLPDPEEITIPSGMMVIGNLYLMMKVLGANMRIKRKLAGSIKASDALCVDVNKDPGERSPSGISNDFVMIEQSGEDLEETLRSQSSLSASATHDDHSDDEPKTRSRTKKRKGSKKRLNSPRALRNLLSPRPSKEKFEDYQPEHAQLKPTTSSLGRMFGKLTRGNSIRTSKYRYSRELREVTRRGSLGPVGPVSVEMTSYDSEQCLMSLADSESQPLPNKRTSKPVLVRKSSKPMFDTHDIVVHPQYDLQVQAKRKVSEHQVRCLIQTRVDHDKEPAIVSCAGYYDDDESILRWTCHTRENVWMQLPIEETT
ncbi:LOW QUALITY PROTEIN: uncharacterized protein [Amphiura filiformis]|uniref:LOW QUALITY PROTEIN: uncharacterized protein n=1 Tax=Amphiura filiformis TaxID=82378 RepID=UPI003B2116EB